MTSKKLTLSLLTASAVLGTTSFAEEVTLDPIVVSSDFRAKKLSETTNSVTVIGEDKIYDKTSQAFVEVLATTPNVNFTSGASKAKYIQIRGIGERSQFANPINPSVGLIVDGIDLSNATLGASLFDMKQIEILRGPQGTTFGANGLAGVVSVQSNEPTKETQGHVETTIGNYNTKAFGAAIGGTLVEDTLIGRVSVYKNDSDGFMKNSFLNRDDTNNIDELNVKSQLRWFVSDKHVIDLNLLHANVDNGYDAFTFDNSRTSHADQAGKDTQRTNAFALKSTYDFDTMKLISTLSHSKSNMTYSYDEDWSYVGEFDASLFPYSSFDQYNRDKKQTDIDIRLVSSEDGRIFNDMTDWTVGVYYKDNKENFNRNYTFLAAPFFSKYDTTTKAIYAQLDTHVNDKVTVITGARVEKWKADYSDSDNFIIDTDEVLVGGKVGLTYQENADRLYYATLSRGYKPGGVNPDNTLIDAARRYKTETLWNIDLGVNSSYFDHTLTSRINLFYGKRKDQQVKSSVVTVRANGSTDFTDYLANAARGTYYGAEAEVDYQANDALHLYATLGLLNATFDEYVDPNPSSLNVNGRTPAQSPKYQYTIGFDYMLSDAFVLKTNVFGKDSYYFSNRHNEKAKSYTLLNASIEYMYNDFTISVWGKNLTDESYQVRGFGTFGNNPGNGYATELYTQQGDPRTFGFTVGYDF
ncbi:MAG TPA: TonB-dependent receptor [Epsilonproteobacteria bacterium]|nr:TonB-dependent receptor [Campylobacterota bacterium]